MWEQIQPPWLLLPVVGALIGWLTNKLAVVLIFRPHQERRILGISVQGLVPRRRKDLAAKVAETVQREFIRPEDIRASLADPALLDGFKEEINRHVAGFIKKKFDSLPTLILTFIPDDLEIKLRKSVVDEIIRALPAVADRLAKTVDQHMDIRKIVQERMEGFSTEKLERIVMEIARRELRQIEILGGVIGFVVGVMQIGMLWAWAHFSA